MWFYLELGEHIGNLMATLQEHILNSKKPKRIQKNLWHFFLGFKQLTKDTQSTNIYILYLYTTYIYAYLKMCRFLCGVLGQLVSDKRKVLNFFDIRIVGFSNYYK